MQAVSARYLEAVRTAHTAFSTVIHRNPFTGVETPIPVSGGQVVDDANANIRRILTLSCPATQPLYDLLDIPGGELIVTHTTRFTDLSTETVPLGVFVVDQDQMGYAPGDTLQLTAPDRSVIIQRNRFGLNRASVKTNMLWEELKRLVEGAWPNAAYPFPGWSQLDKSATMIVGSQLWADGSRETAIRKGAVSHGLQVFFDANGLAVLRPTPVLTGSSPSVWTVDAGAAGVLMKADRTRDRSTVRNAIVVSSSDAGSAPAFAPVVVQNTNPADPLSAVGPLGFVPRYYSSPLIRNATQARLAGVALLSKYLGEARQLTLEAAVNAALASDDVITVRLPAIDRTTNRPTEKHILDVVTTPLMPDGSGQGLQTRATRPLSDDSDGTG